MPGQSTKLLAFRLNSATGVPAYRQIIDQILTGIASGSLPAGAQLPTVRQLAVDLSVNPNTVVRAYRELEIRGNIETQQGVGTFVSRQKVKTTELQRQKHLTQLAGECAARAGQEGFSLQELIQQLQEFSLDGSQKGK